MALVDECGSDLSIGDGFCDEESNNANCGFDGGDCCSDTTQLTCKYCTCKELGGPFWRTLFIKIDSQNLVLLNEMEYISHLEGTKSS